MLFEIQKSDGDFVGLFSCNVGRNDQFVLRHIFLSKVLPIIDDCTVFPKNFLAKVPNP